MEYHEILLWTGSFVLVVASVFAAEPGTIPSIIMGDFESLPGGRGNIAEFGKALRLPTGLSDRNVVRFFKNNGSYYHQFVFENTTFVLTFPFGFGELRTLHAQDKIIDYTYYLEITPNDPNKATIFARYAERDGWMSFTVEAVFSKGGMTVTYTHSDVLDNIMARRSYRRLIPKTALGYYENEQSKQSSNFKQIGLKLLTPIGGSSSGNNKVYLGQSGKYYILKYLLDPETVQIEYPFIVGEVQRRTINSQQVEYVVDVEKGESINTTIVRGQFSPATGDRWLWTAVIDRQGINATYRIGSVEATRKYRRALPLHFFGTFVASSQEDQNFGAFNSVYHGPGVKMDASTALTFRKNPQNSSYELQVKNAFGSDESMVVPFQLADFGDASTEMTIASQPYKISFYYEGGEKPVLFGEYQNLANENSFTSNYTFDGRGVMVGYRRETTTGPMTAKRFFRRQLPLIIYGKYESVMNSKDFSNFALGIYFPELLTKTIMEYYENNGTYFQKFSYPANVNTTFHEVPFTLGERYQQQVKGRWVMEYTYLAYEGDRTQLRTVFVEKRTAATLKSTPSWGEFAVTRDFTQEGYTSTYTYGNVTAQRTYRRLV
ncbi:hypothetical protein RvY_05835 [Ramazzottius varieornatus]|uniref:Uncharacterized protein n=1 Tax=Ramazzottius varieornatus TaxID=947166 RepID=A0A1D1UWF1_RAMVA|nr:hypothetical protein RvY_05835 [Ramazzottius varieornatus]